MVDRNLIREFTVSDEDLQASFGEIEVGADHEHDLDAVYDQTGSSYDLNQIIDGLILSVDADEVLVDIGYKSEGVVSRDEWNDDEDAPEAGNKVQVLLEEVEDEFGLIMLSKRKADRIRDWEKVIDKYAEGDIIEGAVVRKIKGGLLVNIGVNVFLPASQVDIRRPSDIANYIGQTIECVILKIDEARRNIVVSRRKLIEDKRNKLKQEVLADIHEGELRKGVVKNIADFGAFVDLGGIDGLLHITDMSWGRISHPTEVVKIDDEIEVMILNVDREKEKIALGLKQKTKSPWEEVEERYPVGDKVTGTVVNVMSYGAFVKLEDGIEGLVHISEMSWTKRINHPSELVTIGEEVDVVVLGINKEKQEISLGIKQTQPNPWDEVSEKYPVGANVKGTVRNLTNYGAFIELEEGVDGLLHVSDMSWTRKISHASEMLKKSDEIDCQVLSVDEDRKRIALGLKQLNEDPWSTTIPEKYKSGSIVKGNVTKITNFGVFVELEDELEGLLHISELADHKVENPEDIVKVGEELEVRILRVDSDDRKIGLSRKLSPDEEAKAIEGGAEGSASGAAAAAKEDLKGGMGAAEGAPLFSMPTVEPEEEAPEVEAVEVEAATETEEPVSEAETEEPASEEPASEEPASEEPASEEPASEEAAEEVTASDSDESADDTDKSKEEPAAE